MVNLRPRQCHGRSREKRGGGERREEGIETGEGERREK